MTQTKAVAKSNKPMVVEKNITDKVLNHIIQLDSSGALQLPKDYSPANALKAAWLRLQTVEDKNHRKALEVCTQSSIANALLDMVVQGLSPAKNQCYFVVYGNQLTLSRSYFGTITVAKRVVKNLKDIKAKVILKGDEFDYINDANGYTILKKHEQPFENLDNDVVGAYAVKIFEDGTTDMEIMTIKQIKAAWNQGASKGNSPAHKGFPTEMAKKTVINRACKLLINSSSDSDILIDAINRATEAEYTEVQTVEEVQETTQAEIEEKANSIDIEEAVVENANEPSEEEKAKILAKELAETEQEGLDF